MDGGEPSRSGMTEEGGVPAPPWYSPDGVPRTRPPEDSNEETHTLVPLPSCPALPRFLPPPSQLRNDCRTEGGASKRRHQGAQTFAAAVKFAWKEREGAKLDRKWLNDARAERHTSPACWRPC